MTKIDTEQTHVPVCPWCGSENHDWWDGIGVKGDGDSWGSTCGKCEKEYVATIYISYAFFTKTP